MPYTKKTWKNGEVITEAGLNNLEEGVSEALSHATNQSNPHGVTPEKIGAAPAYTYGTEDMVAGVTPLETGKLYFVYEP